MVVASWGVLGELPEVYAGRRREEMRRFVVKFRVGGPELWRTAVTEKTTVEARNVAMAMYEFHRKHARASQKMIVTEVYEEGQG